MNKNRLGNIKVATIISYISLVVSLVSTFFFTPFLLKKVGDDYGVFSLAESIVAWLTMISTAVSASYVRFATKEATDGDPTAKKTTTAFAILMGIISLTSLIIGLTVWFLFRNGVLHSDSLTSDEYNLFNKILIISVIQCSIEILYSFFSSFVVFKKKFVVLRLAVLISAILYPIISYFILLFAPKMIWVVLILYVTRDLFQIIVVLFSFIKLKLRIRAITRTEFKSIFSSILIFSSFIFVNTIIDTVNSTIDKILLGFIVGSSVVTIYQLGMSFRVYLTSLSLALSNNYVPTVNDCAVRKDVEGINTHFLKVGTFQSVLIWLIAGGFAVCGQEFVRMWVGNDKMPVYFIALALILDESFPLCENISIEYQRAMNKHKVRAIIYSICVLLNIIVTYCLLKFVPSINPFVSCLIGTISSDLIGRWISINIYNQKVLKLKVINLFCSYLLIGLLAFVSCSISYLIGLIFIGQTDLTLFLIKGFTFVAVFACSLYLTCLICLIKKPDTIEKYLPSFAFNFAKKICFYEYFNFYAMNRKKKTKKWIVVIVLGTIVGYACSSFSGLMFIGTKDYLYQERRHYIYFGESDFRNNALTLKADCVLNDRTIVTKTATKLKSSSTEVEEAENRLLYIDLPVDTYSVVFRIIYEEDKPDWLTTKVYPIENNKCFYLNYTNLSYTYNCHWGKADLSIETFSYYILPSIDLNSSSNLDGINCYSDLSLVFGHIFKKESQDILASFKWTDDYGAEQNANDYLNRLKNESTSSYKINNRKVAAIMFGSLLPAAAFYAALMWLEYESKK